MVSELPRRRALDRVVRPTRAEVSLSALRHNLAEARRVAAPAEVLAVVKANAYGHGAVTVARALEDAGVGHLGVALVEEGVELRNAGVRAPILVMGGSYDAGWDLVVQFGLTPTVFRVEHLDALQAAAEAGGQSVKVHLKIDTGMNRLGVRTHELGPLLEHMKSLSRLSLEGVASHFANADVAGSPGCDEQLSRFSRAVDEVRGRGFEPRWRHVANTAGTLEVPRAHDQGLCNLVRLGLLLYGYVPAPALAAKVNLRPVLSWRTGVNHVKLVPQGESVSYGSTWTAQRDSEIATLPVGYADGYDRAYSNRGVALVGGRRAPIVGRVCMDMCMLDVTDIPGVRVGDEVVLLGEQGGQRVGAEELADLAGTIEYEVLCGVGARVPRVAVD